jgi:hypothetical protein
MELLSKATMSVVLGILVHHVLGLISEAAVPVPENKRYVRKKVMGISRQ